MPITIRDVAREAGVSTATVSRALRGLGNVDASTAEHIRRVADRLDYVGSAPASRLASGRAGSVGVLTPFISRWYFATLLAGVEAVMHDAGVDLMLHRADPRGVSGALFDRRFRRSVDGVLALGLPSTSPDLAALEGWSMPVTIVGERVAGVSSVSVDDAEGARTAVQHLVNLGHRRIALIGGEHGSPYRPEIDRRQGYCDVLEAAGIEPDPALHVAGRFTTDGGAMAMDGLLALREPPTAVFAMSDEMAFGALRALRQHRMRAGADVAVVGYDGHDMSDLLDLSTIVQPVEELGSMAARDLLHRLGDTDAAPSEHVLPTKLSVRSSSLPGENLH